MDTRLPICLHELKLGRVEAGQFITCRLFPYLATSLISFLFIDFSKWILGACPNITELQICTKGGTYDIQREMNNLQKLNCLAIYTSDTDLLNEVLKSFT